MNKILILFVAFSAFAQLASAQVVTLEDQECFSNTLNGPIREFCRAVPAGNSFSKEKWVRLKYADGAIQAYLLSARPFRSESSEFGKLKSKKSAYQATASDLRLKHNGTLTIQVIEETNCFGGSEGRHQYEGKDLQGNSYFVSKTISCR